jgi:hypothetical protein
MSFEGLHSSLSETLIGVDLKELSIIYAQLFFLNLNSIV